MFLGVDSVGDMVPSRELRQKYSAPRRDVGPPDVGANIPHLLPSEIVQYLADYQGFISHSFRI